MGKQCGSPWPNTSFSFFLYFLFQFYLPSEDVKQNNIIVLSEKISCLFLSPSLLFVALSLSLSLPNQRLNKRYNSCGWECRVVFWCCVVSDVVVGFFLLFKVETSTKGSYSDSRTNGDNAWRWWAAFLIWIFTIFNKNISLSDGIFSSL